MVALGNSGRSEALRNEIAEVVLADNIEDVDMVHIAVDDTRDETMLISTTSRLISCMRNNRRIPVFPGEVDNDFSEL